MKASGSVGGVGAVVVVIGLAVGTARSLHTDERLARIETGLLLPINWKGEPRATMPLRDRMSHCQAPGVSLAVLDKGSLAAVRGWGVARGRRTLAGIAVAGDGGAPSRRSSEYRLQAQH